MTGGGVPAPAAFRPARFLSNRHLQTIWPMLVRRAPRPEVRDEAWALPGGDVLDLSWLPHREGAPGVLVLHGLEGSAQAPYVRSVLASAATRGWNGVAMNFRSCGAGARTRRVALASARGRERSTPGAAAGGRGTAPGAAAGGARGAPGAGAAHAALFYHSGRTEELALLVERLAGLWPRRAAVGFSLGGNVLLKWLGETGATAPLDAAVAVSVPFDLGLCAGRLDGPGFWAWLYRERFLRSLRRKALEAAAAGAPIDVAAVARCRSFAAFDGLVTAPLFGFADAADYWRRSSAAAFVDRIRTPTLVVAAEDDPFVPPEALPLEAIARNEAISLWLSARGGHLGFVGGAPWRARYELDGLIPGFLAGLLGNGAA